jgi:hypothetical protein
MKAFFDKFQSLKGSSFISIKNYEALTSGEIADHIININISVLNAKKTDFERLQACKESDLLNIANAKNISLELLKTALTKLTERAEKNLSENKEDRTNQSIGQTDAYIFLTPAIKLHKETLNLYIFGQRISKKVIVPGTYENKPDTRKPLTIAQDEIKKYLDLRSEKYGTYVLGNIDEIKINGETLERVK